MQSPCKLLWLYILDDCDHAGIWHVDIAVAEIKIGEKIDVELAKKEFGDKIHVFHNGEKWFIPDFISFQYGVLTPTNRTHISVIAQLNKYDLKQLASPLQGAKDKDKDKEGGTGEINDSLCFDLIKSRKIFLDSKTTIIEPTQRLFKISEEQTIKYINEFFDWVQFNGEQVRSIYESKDHFKKWMRMHTEKEKKLKPEEPKAYSSHKKPQYT